MSAFFIARIHVKNNEKMAEYASSVGATFTEFGGKLALHGAHNQTLVGAPRQANLVRIVEFPTSEDAQNWFHSPKYQALTKLREAACEMELDIYEMPSS